MILVPPIITAMGADAIRPAFYPLGAIAGGLLFGASMSVAGGCAAGVWYKIGGGSLEAAAAILGMVAGASALEVGPLSFVRTALHSVPAPAIDLGVPLFAVALPVGLLLAGLVLRTKVSVAGDWTWRRTGLLIGLTGTLAWPLSLLADRPFGMAVVPGTVSMLTRPLGVAYDVPVWDLVFVLGIPLGAFLASCGRAARCERPAPRTLLRRYAGGLGLGIGASLAAGCTVGHGLTGLALLAPGSVVSLGAIFAGAVAAPLIRSWHAETAA